MYSWDPAQSAENRRKHGISFEEARDAIFEGKSILAVGVAYATEELRHAIIGKFKDCSYVGIFTFRQGEVRIISVRRARHEEERQAKSRGI